MGTSYDRIVEAVKTFMKQVGAKGVDGTLNIVREIEQHLQSIYKLILGPEQKAGDKGQGLEAAKDACKIVAYGDYLPRKAEACALTILVDGIGIKNLPESLRPKGIKIKGYVDDINSQLKTIESVVEDIAQKLKGFQANGYQISKVEKKDLETMTLEVGTNLEICKDCQTRAEEALKQFDSDVNSYSQEQRNAAYVKVGCAVLFGIGAGVITAVALAASAVAVISTGTATAGGGLFMAGAAGGLSFRSYTSLLVGAAVSVPLVYLVLKRWFTERQFCIELLSILRNYRDLINESQSLLQF